MQATYRGVLLPEHMQNASEMEKDAYSEMVKKGNRAFLDAYWLLEDAAQRQGLTVDELEQAA